MRRAALAALLVCAGCGTADAPPTPDPASTTVGGQNDTRGRFPSPRVMRARAGETLGAVIRRRTALRARPSPKAKVIVTVAKRTRFRSASVKAVMKQRGQWLGLATEELANGRLGWVRQTTVKLLRETWRIRVDLSQRRGVLYHQGKRYAAFPVAVGTDAYPTPTGTYGVTDRLDTGGAGSPYGCCVLALTGHQPDVPQDWPGGDRLAIHGTSDPASIGTAASHGCLRASERTMRLLLAKVPLGAQVEIRS